VCQFKSGIAVRINESEVSVKVLKLNDSHTDIHDKYYIRNCNHGLSRFSTPVELVPTKLDFEDQSCWTLVFDDCKPDWWTECMTDQCISQLLKAAKDDFAALKKGRKYCSNSLSMDRLTSIPEGFNPNVRFNLYLNGLTRVPEDFKPTVGGDLHMPSLTSVPESFNPKVGGCLILTGVSQLPKLFHPRVKKFISCASIVYLPFDGGLMPFARSIHLSFFDRLFRACMYRMSKLNRKVGVK